jgi:hypothetical protein
MGGEAMLSAEDEAWITGSQELLAQRLRTVLSEGSVDEGQEVRRLLTLGLRHFCPGVSLSGAPAHVKAICLFLTLRERDHARRNDWFAGREHHPFMQGVRRVTELMDRMSDVERHFGSEPFCDHFAAATRLIFEVSEQLVQQPLPATLEADVEDAALLLEAHLAFLHAAMSSVGAAPPAPWRLPAGGGRKPD